MSDPAGWREKGHHRPTPKLFQFFPSCRFFKKPSASIHLVDVGPITDKYQSVAVSLAFWVSSAHRAPKRPPIPVGSPLRNNFPPASYVYSSKIRIKQKNVKMNVIVDAHPRFRYLTPLPGYQMLADENEWKQNLRFVSVPFEKQKPFSTGQRRKL
jgi:hypothetical protein